MVWPLSGLLAHSQSCGTTLMGSGILAGVDLQGAQGQEGQAQLALSAVVHFGRGPAALGGRQADPSEVWICRSTALGVCEVQASSLTRTGSL